MASSSHAAASSHKSYPSRLNESNSQSASAPRTATVHDSFYTHFLYEMLNQIMTKHDAKKVAQPAGLDTD